MLVVIVLLLLLGHPNYTMRQAAHDGLVELAEPLHLLPFLDHPDPEVRWRADLLIMQTGWKELRRFLASLQSMPFIDADPDWQRQGLQIYLSRAFAHCHERGVRVGPRIIPSIVWPRSTPCRTAGSPIPGGWLGCWNGRRPIWRNRGAGCGRSNHFSSRLGPAIPKPILKGLDHWAAIASAMPGNVLLRSWARSSWGIQDVA